MCSNWEISDSIKKKSSGIPGCRENVSNGEPLTLSDKEVDENNLNFSSIIIWEDSLSIPEAVKKLALLKHI